jgi:hypothetical protein
LNTIASFEGKDIWLKIFTQEIFFDFESYEDPLKRQVSIIKLMRMNLDKNDNDEVVLSNLDTYIDAYLNINEAGALDTTFQNPYF